MDTKTNELTSHRANELRNGFSLVEFMVVIGIMAVMAVAGLNSYFSLKNSKSLENMGNLVLSDITYTMERSKTQESGLQWWMNFNASATPNFYLICSGTYSGSGANTDCGSGNTAVKRVQTTSGLSFSFTPSGSYLDVIFAKSTGLPTSTTSVVVTSAVTTLMPKTIVVNSNGRVDTGSVAIAPTVITTSVSLLNTTSARLNGTVNPNGASTNGWFRWSPSSASCASLTNETTHQSLGSGSLNVPYYQDIPSGLITNTTYYFCAIAVNSVNTTADSVISFTTLGVPGAPTGVAGTAGNTQVALTWTAPASIGGTAITSYRVYRSTTSGSETLLSTDGCSGLGNVLTCTDTGLTNGTQYFYKVSAVNAVGEGAQSSEVNATPATTPTITTPIAPSFGSKSATLGATVTSNGGATLTARGTCWATTANPTLATGNCLAEGGTGVSAFTHSRTGLPSNTTIHYTGYATNPAGTSYTTDDTFMTSGLIGSWTLRSSGTGTVAINAITYSPSLTRFLIGTAAGVTKFSDDSGVTWSAGVTVPNGTGGSNMIINNLVWSPTYSLFIATGTRVVASSTTVAVWTSANGSSWNGPTAAAGSNAALADGGSVLIGGDSSGTTGRSTNGATWSAGGNAGTGIHRGAAYGAGLFVLVGDGGSVYTSPDGNTWTSRISCNGNISHVAYSPTLSAFLAVNTIGGTSCTSANGTGWSAGSSGGGTNSVDDKTRWVGVGFMTALNANGAYDLRETPTSVVVSVNTGAASSPNDIATNGTVLVAVHDSNIVRTAPLNP